MICLVFRPSDLKNIVEVYNLRNNAKGGGKNLPGPGEVCALDWADFSAMMQPKEKLYLLAHGSTMKVSTGKKECSAPELAKKLLDAKLRPDVGSIKLVACNTGTNPNNGLDPFCSVLSREIYTQSGKTINVRVTGVVGIEVVQQDGKIRGKNVRFSDTAEYKAMNYDVTWKDQVTAWESEIAQMNLGSGKEILQAADQMTRKTQAFFEKLYEINANYIQSKNDSRFHSPPNQ